MKGLHRHEGSAPAQWLRANLKDQRRLVGSDDSFSFNVSCSEYVPTLTKMRNGILY
jgi:hypothetical protein